MAANFYDYLYTIKMPLGNAEGCYINPEMAKG